MHSSSPKTPSDFPPEKDQKFLFRKKVIALSSLGIMIGLFVVILIWVGRPLIDTFNHKEEFRQWVSGAGILGDLAMIGVSALQVVVAIIPGEPFELAAGYAFGWLRGMLLCMTGFALASSAVFLLVKRFGMKFVLLFFSEEKIASISFLRDSNRLNFLTFILFLIPGTPKDVLTYFVGLTPMTLPRFLLITSIARIPSILSSTITGSFVFENAWGPAIITYSITAVLTVISILVYRKRTRAMKTPEKDIPVAGPEKE